MSHPPRSVLVVEDDPIQLKAYGAVARRYGMTLTPVSRSTDVLRAAMVERPDAIILDLILEDGNSLKVLETLRISPETAGIPVAVISAYLGPEVCAVIEDMEGVSMLSKPWTVDELLATLSGALASRPE